MELFGEACEAPEREKKKSKISLLQQSANIN